MTVSNMKQAFRSRAALCFLMPLVMASSKIAQESEDMFELSPFSEDGSDNQEYRATSTLAGTRIRTDLHGVGSSISVSSDAFANYVGATDSVSLLTYAVGVEVGGLQENNGGLDHETRLDVSDANLRLNENTRTHRLTSAENPCDLFVSEAPFLM